MVVAELGLLVMVAAGGIPIFSLLDNCLELPEIWCVTFASASVTHLAIRHAR